MKQKLEQRCSGIPTALALGGCQNYCQQNNLDFDVVYTNANISYNDGYQSLGKSQYSKYVLKHSEGKIGGHCVVNNAKILDSESAKRLLETNAKL